MPGTSKNFEGGSWDKIWPSCEHRSFFWLIICFSAFNLPFFFFFFLILHPLAPCSPNMNRVPGHHDVSEVRAFRPELLSFGGSGFIIACWGKDRLWGRASIPTVLPASPPPPHRSEHQGALGSPWFILTPFRLRCFFRGWNKPHSWEPHTRTPHAVSSFILQVGGAYVEKSQSPNPPLYWMHFFSNKTLDPSVAV